MAKKPCDCDSGKMTFEQWAAAGGAVPLSFKGREKAWANQVKKFAAGGQVKMAGGGDPSKPYIGYRRAGRRPESQQDREASANIPVAVARGLVSGSLGMPGDIESLARLPYELITGKESPTILPTSGDIEKRLPFRGASQTPVGQMFTGASQLAGGAYTGPGSGARAVMAVPKAIKRAGQDFVQSAGQTVSPLTVYQGSPHKFAPTPKNPLGEFDASKIGTGEGAQAYGYGHYLAQAPGVAEDYRRSLAGNNLIFADDAAKKSASQMMPFGFDDPIAVIKGALGLNNDVASAIKTLRGSYDKDPDLKAHANHLADLLESGAVRSERGGHVYTVDLPDEKIALMLDYDKAINEQAPEVLRLLERAGINTQSSAKAGTMIGGQEMHLAKHGIPGIKYLDQSSRGASGTGKWLITMKNGEQKVYDFKPNDDVLEQMGATAEPTGTRNFVVFPGEEDALTILERKKEGGEVGMKKGGSTDSIRPTEVKNKGALGVANALRKAHEFVSKPFGYDNPPAAMISEFLGIPAVSRTLERIGYGEPLTTGKGMTLKPRDDTTEAALSVLPLAPMTKGLPVGAVIKPKGGNFMTGSVERAVDPLKTRGLTQAQAAEMAARPTPIMMAREGVLSKSDEALNQWIDRNLTNYIKKEMATPEDPVRKLAEQGIVHIPSEQVGTNRYKAPERRTIMGGEQLGQSEAARAWEDASDVGLRASRIRDLSGNYKEPWMENADPSTKIYSLGRETDSLGFDHIVDVLKQDLAAGRIRPEQLSKVSMEQAVRRTYEYDQELAAKMNAARAAQREGLPVYREYPEGYRWVELNKPGSFASESEAMGHSVRGYEPPKGHPDWVESSGDYGSLNYGHGGWEGIKSGKAKVYSLVDKKGQPHATIETKSKGALTDDDFGINDTRIVEGRGDFGERGYRTSDNQFFETYADAVHHEKIIQKPTVEELKEPPSITQVKGKQNRAPNEEYLPFVQDFVRSGEWSGVGDLPNTRLFRIETGPRATEFDKAAFERYGKYATTQELDELEKTFKPQLSEGMKAGGEVKMAAGGISKLLGKGAKAAKVEHPLVFPRAEPKTREEIRPIAQRVAEQMTGEFVRQNPKVTTNPAGKSRKQFERERNIPLETRNVVPEKNVPPVDYEKLKDYAIVGVPGDPSMGGVARAGSFDDPARATVELTRVGDITPDSPVPLFGGPRYGDDEKFWASNLGAATPIQSNVTALGELYDAPVLGKYIKMAPDSANFAMHNLDSLLAIQRPEQLSKGKLEQLNRLIRKGSPKYGKFPGFPGFDDPVDVLLQSQLNSDLRKHIAETLTKPTITQALGLPNGQDVVAAITHPELRNLETGVSGFSIGRMVPGATLKKGESAHPTYDTDIPGQLIGRSKYPTPYEIAFPDTTAYARSQLKPGVQEFNMMKLLGPRERIDQQYVDEMKTFEELMKQYTGKKKGGAVKSGLSSIKKV